MQSKYSTLVQTSLISFLGVSTYMYLLNIIESNSVIFTLIALGLIYTPNASLI
jgi:hypothetical protein